MILREQRSEKVAEILGDIWEENYIENRPLIEKMEGKGVKSGYMGTPALVVGAGPSLEKNIDDIASFGNYTIIACDKCCARLNEEGICPQYVVALNAEKTDVRKWLEPVNEKKVTLVAPCGVHPDTFVDWVGEIIFINAFTPTGLHDRIYSEIGIGPMSIGSNAGTFAYTLAYMNSYNPIAYIGMDFSFLRRSDIMDVQDTTQYNIVEMTDINNEVRYLTLGWFDMAQAFQERVDIANSFNIETYNCTEGGINYSQYVRVKTLKEFNEMIG